MSELQRKDIARAWDHLCRKRDIGSFPKLFWRFLADFSAPGSVADIVLSQQEMADEFGVSVDKIQRAIKTLRGKGWIFDTVRNGPGNFKSYTLLWGW
jgi:hypothetical protein